MAIALQVGWHGPNSASSSARGSPQSSHWLHGSGRKRPWSEDSEEMLQLMMGQFDRRKETLDLLGGSSHSSSSSSSSSSSAGPLELLDSEPDKPLPCGWEKCLDLKTGAVYYMNSISGAKTLDDPRESTFPSFITTKASSTNLNDRPASTVFRYKKDPGAAIGDDLNLSSLANLFLTQSSVQTTPPHMSTLLLHSEPKFEEKPISSLISEGKLSTDPSKKKINLIPANDAVLDIGLELNLNLSTFTSAVNQQKPRNLNDQCNNVVQERRVAQKVSLLSESTSSSHSIWRLQTREDSVYSAINCYEAEKPKIEDNPPNNNMMVIMGCPCCLMYVMLWKSEPKCPKCGSFVINTDFPSSSGPSLSPHKPLSLP